MRSAMLFLILSLALVLNPSVSMAGKFEEVSSLSSEPVLKVREFEDGEAAQAILEMSAFLKRQATIRVLISEAPGNGHQIAAVRLMRRLRELGFEGEFEVLFDPKVAERLRFLIPGFRVDEADGLQRINSRILGKIVTVPTDKPGKLLRKQIELGFSAADDRMFSTELRSAMNVRTTVNLQPKNWNGRKSSHLVISGDTQTSIRHLKDLSVLNSPIPAEQLFDVIKDEMEASRSALKTPGILKLIENIDSIDLLPGYSNYIRADAPNIIEKTVKALLEAKAIAPERFTRPIIIPLMTDLQALKVTTEKIISRLGVASIDITEAGKLEQAIAGLGQPITIVHIGPIPEGRGGLPLAA
ncbi:MAG: hypothetical protein V4692_05490, partial [Bdellovibrionota bacterium]